MKPLRILQLEDNVKDAEVVKSFLAAEGLNCEVVVVQTKAEFASALERGRFDLIISDFSLPSYDGRSALLLAAGTCPDVPFIIFSGTIGEHAAIESLKTGATDYVLKQHPTRLASAVRRALLEAEVRVERKRIEERLKRSEARMRAVLDAALDAVIGMDDQGRIIDWSARAEAIFGWTRQEIIGKQLSDTIIPDQYRDAHRRGLHRFLETGEGPVLNRRVEFTALRRDGTEFPMEVSISPLQFGETYGFSAFVADITERKRAQAELVQAKEAAEAANQDKSALLAAISSVLIVVEEDDRIVYWNGVAEETFGILSVDVLGRSVFECGIMWEWPPIQESVSMSLSKGSPTRLENFRYQRPDGKRGFLQLTVSPVKGEGNRWKGYILLGTDITERRMMECQLSHAQKLESIGQLAAGIAHEINTPTQYIGDNLRFLQNAFRDVSRALARHTGLLEIHGKSGMTSELAAQLEAVAKEADLELLREEIPKAIQDSIEGNERVAKIVRSMKEFAHPGTGDKAATDLNKAVESTITVARNEWKYVAEMVTDFDPDLPMVPVLLGDFNQVVLNMIVNAAHAIADVVGDGANGKGTISVRTRRDADWAEIRISDTGTGIPEDVRSRIFDPFFTTKSVGKGTGQGLAISHAVVVEKHGGRITVETEVGTGTTFIIRLPINPLNL